MRTLRSLLALGCALASSGLACSSSGDDAAASADAVTAIPETAIRNQKDTGNCWLYATAAWAESLEYAALIQQGTASAADLRTSPAHFSVAYWDYWDWFTKITGNTVKGRTVQEFSDALDSGGSWGSAAEIIAKNGLMRSADFVGSGANRDATVATAALATMVTSLSSGALHTVAARKDARLVRSELDRAFGISAAISGQLTASFGADGSHSFMDGSASAAGKVIAPQDLEVLLPRPSQTPELHPLREALGERAPGDDPDRRVGDLAWQVTSFENGSPSANREYFKRVQRALHAGAPLPISWYVASNGDPDDIGVYKESPPAAADADESGGHETLIADYQVDNVPGFGLLPAGTSASPEAMNAALDDRATIVFLRVKNSWGGHAKTNTSVGYNDLYMDYLTGTVHVCPKGVTPTSKKCTDEVPLEDITLPAGF